MSGVGRPRGRTQETLNQSSLCQLLRDVGTPPAMIAAKLNLSTARVYELLKLPSGEPEEGPDPALRSEPESERPARLSARTLFNRACLAMNEVNGDARLRGLDREHRRLWLEIVQAIGQLGDGVRLQLEPSGFSDRADLAATYGGSEDELGRLCARRLLIDEGDAIALPGGLGLMRERPNRRRVPRARGERRPGPWQHHMPYVIPGGLGDSRKIGISPESVSGEMAISPESGSDEIGVFLESDGLACVAAAAADSEKNQSFSSSSSSGSRARDSSETPPDSGEIAATDSTDITSKRSDEPQAVLAAELTTAAKLGRGPLPWELDTVRGWLAAGASADTVRAVVASKMRTAGKRHAAPPGTLAYFDKAIRESLDAGLRPASVTGTVPMSDAPPRQSNPAWPDEAAWRARHVALSRAAEGAFNGWRYIPGWDEYAAIVRDPAHAEDALLWGEVFLLWRRHNRRDVPLMKDFLAAVAGPSGGEQARDWARGYVAAHAGSGEVREGWRDFLADVDQVGGQAR